MKDKWEKDWTTMNKTGKFVLGKEKIGKKPAISRMDNYVGKLRVIENKWEEQWRKELKTAYEQAASFDDASDVECLIRRAISLHKESLTSQKERMVEMIGGMRGKEFVVVGLSKEPKIEPANHELLDKSDIIKKLEAQSIIKEQV